MAGLETDMVVGVAAVVGGAGGSGGAGFDIGGTVAAAADGCIHFGES